MAGHFSFEARALRCEENAARADDPNAGASMLRAAAMWRAMAKRSGQGVSINTRRTGRIVVASNAADDPT